MEKIFLPLFIIPLFHQTYAQPHLHIERNLEALRLDGSQSWMSFYNGPTYQGYLWNNQGTMTLGTTEFNPTGQIKLVTNLEERMTIDNLGRVGVNTSSPLAPFHIKHDNEALRISGAQSFLNFVNGLGGNAGYLWNKDLFNFELGTSFGNTTGSLTLRANNNLGIWIDPDGSVGIKSKPTMGFPFEVDGTGRFFAINIGQNWSASAGTWFEFRKNQELIGYLSPSSGWVHVSQNKQMQNIEPLRSGVLKSLGCLKACTYEYDYGPRNASSIGFMANEIKDSFPELIDIHYSDQGTETISIAYGKVSVIAIKAIQEQQVIINSQKLKIEHLEKHLEDLENGQKVKIELLEAQIREMQKSLSGLVKT